MDSGDGTILLITDFGEGPYTGILRSLIHSINSRVKVIDVDNNVPSYNILAGAYIIYNTYYWAPKGSVILAVIDPGVGTTREAIAVKAGDYVFIGPNNGVLYPSILREEFICGVSLIPERVVDIASHYFRGKLPGKWSVSTTFHGRDVFAPAAALYTLGVELSKLGTPISFEDLKKTSLEHVVRDKEGSIRLKVLYIDKFGNLALSAKPGVLPIRTWEKVLISTPFAQGATYTAVVGRKFSDVNPGDLVLYVNSFGFLELAVNLGSAAKKLGVDIGDTILLTPIQAQQRTFLL